MEYDKPTEDLLDKLVEKSNRSKPQTKLLFELCNENFEELVLLEKQILVHLVHYCPGDREEVDKLLLLKTEDNEWYKTKYGKEWMKKCSVRFDGFLLNRSRLNKRLRKKKKLGEFHDVYWHVAHLVRAQH